VQRKKKNWNQRYLRVSVRENVRVRIIVELGLGLAH
jgi:hypothetical protein